MKTEIKDGVNITTFEAGKYLSDVISELPNGIINKTETGLGATTLELKCPRHSIIVEPLKVTASSKADKHGACYVGSPTSIHPDRDKKANEKRIKDYLADTTVEHKKFVTVADSLSALINTLVNEKVDLTEYFLMIDEADRTQLDVSYRSTMEGVLKIYKKHNPLKRCMITATPIKFNDPDLAKESYHKYQYDKPVSRNIKLFHTNTGVNCLVEKALKLFETTEDKIVIAINEVSLAADVAQSLVSLGVPKEAIKILCSPASKIKAGSFYGTLDSSILPVRVTLKTSAYFNGFDLDDRYHLFTYIQSNRPHHILSEKTLKQIAGRCRHKDGLLSENIICQDYDKAKHSHKRYSLAELEHAANKVIDALKCVDSHLKHSPILKDQASVIFGDMTEKTSIYGYPLVVLKDSKHVISYLSIDAILEVNLVMNTQYNLPNSMERILALENKVVSKDEDCTTAIISAGATSVAKFEDKESVEKTINGLIKFGSTSSGVGMSVGLLERHARSGTPKYKALKIYEEFRVNVDNNTLRDLILAGFDKVKTINYFNVLEAQLKFIVIEETGTLKQAVKTRFEVDTVVDRAEIIRKMKELVKGFSKTKNIPSDNQLVKRFNMLVDTSVTKKNKQKHFKVQGYNVLHIEVLSHTKEFNYIDDIIKMIASNQSFT